MAYFYSPARACYIMLLLHPFYYMWFMAHHTAALSFSYDFSNPNDLHHANLTYLGNSTAGNGIITLTNTIDQWSSGGVAYPQPVRLWDHRTGRRASFTTNFSFAITPTTPISGNDTTPISGNDTTPTSGDTNRGDGMAFFIRASRLDLPPDSKGGFLGLISNTTNDDAPSLSTVGIEFDTNRNVWDPQDTIDHIGIDVNNISSDIYYTTLGNGMLSGTMSVSVEYNGNSKVLSVSLWLANGNVHHLERPVDLKAEGVPQYATIGFSAATSENVESHQLLSWSFNSTGDFYN